MNDDFLDGRRNIEELLPETIAFTREILTDLARAPVVSYDEIHAQDLKTYPDRPRYPHIFIADVACYDDQKSWELYSQRNQDIELSLHRDSYKCATPYTRDAFTRALHHLLIEKGLTKQDQSNPGYEGMQPGNFAAGGCISLCGISDYGVAIYAPREQVQSILKDIATADLTNACLQGLKEAIFDITLFAKSACANRKSPGPVFIKRTARLHLWTHIRPPRLAACRAAQKSFLSPSPMGRGIEA
ncbi:MAG TPA: hypothetical protein VIF12_06855 [Micavibrio sp.]|jgi:hypothetical protein